MKIPMKLADSEEMLTFKTAFKFPPVNVGGEKDHSKLENLDYANSGHTGFASSEDIPTKVSQLENDKGYIDNSASNLVNYELKGKTGTNLGVSIDNTTYVMTIDLKNTAGDVISTGSVDLPLESMVISASYDDSTKEIVLTLQSGEEVKFSVADLVSGLVSQSTFDTKMNEISQEFSHKFDMPYYYEYNGDTDFEDTSETTLAMFNEIKELMEAGQKPCIIVKKGATGANSYITYHFVVPQFGSLDTTYIMLKGSPVRKDGSTFNLVALNCEKDPETNQIKRVYEKKADGSIEIGKSEEIIEFKANDTNEIKKQKGQKFLDYYLEKGTIPNAVLSENDTILSLCNISKFSDHLTLSFSAIYGIAAPVCLGSIARAVNIYFTDNVVTLVSGLTTYSMSPTLDYSKTTNGALTTINTKAYTPTTDYHPSTKLYTDQRVQSIAPDYNATSTYKVGDYVSYQGKFYKCTTAIETAEAWNSEHWSETTVKDEMGSADFPIYYIRGVTNDSGWSIPVTTETKATLEKVYKDYANGKLPIVYVTDKSGSKYGINQLCTVQKADFSSALMKIVGTSQYIYDVEGMPIFQQVVINVNGDKETGKVSGISASINNGRFFLTEAYNNNKYNSNAALTTKNTTEYTPTGDYNPATKKYVDDAVAGVGGGGGVFKITLTANQTAGYDANKTIDEIQAAISANKTVIAVVDSDEYPLKYHTETELRFTSIELNRSVLVLYSDGVWTMQDTNMLKTSGGNVNGNINMNSNAITNIQKLHVDGEAPVYIGSTIETGVTNASRITGIAGGGVAIVRANTQSTYDPFFVADPTNINHAATKNYVDNKLISIQGYDATKTQTLKNINGVLTWQTDGE